MPSLKTLFAARDLTTGTPWKRILSFSVPLLLGNLAQQAYSAVDSIVVGNYVGDNALAAVGTSFPLINLLIVLFVAISTGVGIMVAQYFGAKRKEDLAMSIGNAITVTALSSILLMALTPFVTAPLLRFLAVPESIFQWSHDYLSILMYGILGMAYFNILSGILRGMGDSYSPLLYLLVATVLNIILDIYFVVSLGLGVAGVAYATVIAQGVSAVLSLRKLYSQKDVVELKMRHLIPSRDYMTKMARLGLPSGATQAVFSVAMVFVQSLVNSFGEFFIAANLLIMRVDGFIMLPNFSFGMALTTYTGQNVGARKLDRVREGTKQGLRLAVGVSAVLTLLVYLFGDDLMHLFTSTQELITFSMRMLTYLIPGYIAMSVTQALSGVMRGSGDTMTPMWISLITVVLVRLPLAYIFVYFWNRPESLLISMLIAWLFGAVATYVMYRRGKWQRSSLFEEEEPALTE